MQREQSRSRKRKAGSDEVQRTIASAVEAQKARGSGVKTVTGSQVVKAPVNVETYWIREDAGASQSGRDGIRKTSVRRIDSEEIPDPS